MAGTVAQETAPTVQPAPAEARPDAAGKGARTRDRILDIAYDSIVRKGFASTSIEELVEAAQITKSGFFYHFRDKNQLARILLERFVVEDREIMDAMTARARALSEDPLQSLLIFLNLYAEMLDAMPDRHPGCLVAAITYQDQMFDPQVRRMNADAVREWRGRFAAWLEEIEARSPPVRAIDREALADGFTAVVEGAIILARALDEPALLGRQVRLYRELVKASFVA